MFDPSLILPEKPHRMSRAEYDRLIALGYFETDALNSPRCELLEGVIVDMSPMGTAHVLSVRNLIRLFAPLVVANRVLIQPQSPIALSDYSEPEPDVALHAPDVSDSELASVSLLLIEVAESSLAKDKGYKADLYAAAEQPEYWVVDLKNRRVIVYRDPQSGSYASIRTFADGESVAPLAFPDLALAVTDILPRRA